jgi:hypothetical protein
MTLGRHIEKVLLKANNEVLKWVKVFRISPSIHVGSSI